MRSFVEKLKSTLHIGQTIADRVLAGTGAEMVSIVELCMLMNDSENQPVDQELVGALTTACMREDLRSVLRHFDHSGEPRLTLFVRRKDAMEFLSTKDVEPRVDSPMWCWLHGASGQKDAEPRAKKLRPCQEDKLFFQMYCRMFWADHPEMKVDGPLGLIDLFNEDELTKRYGHETLRRWARDARPSGKGKPGRPGKMNDS